MLKSRFRAISFVMASDILLTAVVPAGAAEADDALKEEIAQLRQMIKELAGEVRQLKESKSESTGVSAEYQQQLDEIRQDVTRLNESPIQDIGETLSNFKIGGYGEMHANFNEGSEKDKMDFHRMVMYLGYDFSDWIKLNTEIELEHAFVKDTDSADDESSDTSGGEISLEQAYVDFLLSDSFNVRAGRVLTPVGIINQNHEPILFNGVERPNFSKYIIPSTWSSDGIGLFGALNSEVNYQAYVVGGLDGSMFSSSGIRSGRIKDKQSLSDPVFTGRVDYRPWQEALANSDQALRMGVSGYFGGVNNSSGGGNSGADADISMVSADFEYSVGKFDFRGVVAHTEIDGAENLAAGVGEEMFGWYLEAGYHFMPDEWKTGKLAKSDAVVFVRYEEFDTQYKVPSGVTTNGTKDKEEITFGINFYPVPNFVIKADYQIFDDASSNGRDDQFNLGLGWAF